MPDFEQRLVLDFGLVRKKTEWRTAWDLRESAKPPIQGMLEALTEELFRELADQRRSRPGRAEPRSDQSGKDSKAPPAAPRRRRME